LNFSTAHIDWPDAPDAVRLDAQDVHLWAASLQVAVNTLEKLRATLSADELERANRFKFDLHRNRYIAGRGILRSILAGYLETVANALEFSYSAHQKPELTPATHPNGLHFNLAHTGDLALIAVTNTGPLGVDVEEVRVVRDVGDLVARFFSQRENELFQQLAPEKKSAAFFNLWTRKEALLKATGEGITGGLNRVEVSFLEDEPTRLLAINGDSEQARPWTLKSFKPLHGFVGALAIKARSVQVQCWKWAD
jgi:4'-phosphopantetheinyl transferase